MKKAVCIIFLLPVLIFSLSGRGSCFDIGETSDEISTELFSAMEDDVADILDSMGINSENFLSYQDASLSGIGNFFKTTLKDKAISCFKNTSGVFAVTLMLCLVSLFLGSDGDKNYVSFISGSTVSLLSVSVIENSLSAAVSVLKLSGNFMIAFVPVYTAVISLAGGATSAFTYNSLVLFFAEAVSGVISSLTVDFMGVFFCLAMAFSVGDSISIDRFLSFVNKAVGLVFGFFASVFTGLLSIKGVLCVAADSVTVKGIRFLISSMIPVVGASISEAYSSVLGSINLIKGSVAAVGIIAVLVINLPVIIENLIYCTVFSFLAFMSESCGDGKTAGILRCVSGGIRILLLLCVFEMFLLIISTGIMLSIKGGG